MASPNSEPSTDVEHGRTKPEQDNAAAHAEAAARAEPEHHHHLNEWYIPGTDTAAHAWVGGSHAVSTFWVRFRGKNRWVSWTTSLHNIILHSRTSTCSRFLR
jgi:hypothetical protein